MEGEKSQISTFSVGKYLYHTFLILSEDCQVSILKCYRIFLQGCQVPPKEKSKFDHKQFKKGEILKWEKAKENPNFQ
jgi:hypothetical protein